MKDYILVFMSVVLLAAYFVCNKLYQKRTGADREAVFFFHGMLGLLIAAFAFALSGGRPQVTWFSLMMAALMNTFSVSYSLLGFQMMEAGKMASYTLFLMSGGMIVPYIVGIFALGEPVTLARSLGLAAIVGGVMFANGMGERMNRRLWRRGILVFLLNGMVSVVSKLHQIEDKMETVPTLSFVFLGGLCSFALCSVAWMVCREKGKKNTPCGFACVSNYADRGSGQPGVVLFAAAGGEKPAGYGALSDGHRRQHHSDCPGGTLHFPRKADKTDVCRYSSVLFGDASVPLTFHLAAMG